MWLYFMAGITYGFAAGVQPGPLNGYLMSLTLRYGFRRALPAAFAPLLSDAFIVTLTLSVLTRVPVALIRWLHLAGGVFVLYLAFDAWRSFRNFGVPQQHSSPRNVGSLWKAALVNLLNPSPYLGWSLVLGPLLLQGWRVAPRWGIAVVAGFYAALIGTTVGIVWLFHFARNFSLRVVRGLIATSAITLLGFAGYQLWLASIGKR